MTIQPPEQPPTGGPTKDEILAIALQKLQLKIDDTFADIGCGTGKVTLSVAPLVCMVHAIDVRREACAWTEKEVTRQGLKNVKVYHENASSVLSTLTQLDTAFVGGSRDLPDIINQLVTLQVRCVVIAAVLMDTLGTAVKKLQENNFFHEVIHVQVSKSVPLAGGIMLKPLDPVYLICGGKN